MDKSNNIYNEYERAAALMKEFVQEENYIIPTQSDEIEKALATFRKKFAPEVLENLKDDEILSLLFYTEGDNTNSLCCWLEMSKESRYFGSIAGGSAYKFGLYQRKDSGQWVIGSSKKPQIITENKALQLGKEIRDALVKGSSIVKNAELHTLEDYEKLHDLLVKEFGEQICNGWVHKYFSMLYPEKLSGFNTEKWQLHVLRALKIRPSGKFYARSGQIAMIQNINQWYYQQFIDVFMEKFGDLIRFIRLGCKDDEKIYAQEWAREGVIGIGWPKLGDLSAYTKDDSLDKDSVKQKLVALYYPDKIGVASTKAGEIARFYNENRDRSYNVFVIMQGQQLLALTDQVGEYFYDSSSAMPHKKKARWCFVFKPGETLPHKNAYGGVRTTCFQIRGDEDNLLYLYEKYFYGEEVSSIDDMPGGAVSTSVTEKIIADDVVDETPCYWWLNASPKIWSFSSLAVGDTQSYTIFNENGNPRRIPQNFADVKPGDKFIGYESNPVKKVVALGEFTNKDEQEVYFRKTETIANTIDYKTLKALDELQEMEYFNSPQGSLFKLTKAEYDCIMDEIREYNPRPPEETFEPYSKAEFLSEVFMTEEQYDELKDILEDKKNIILQGAPGVGKTFTATRLAYAIMGEKDDIRIKAVQFHQNYSYEDFIMGYKPDGEGFTLTNGVFYNFCKEAENHPDKKYFFIIDEINRGNMSKIFGELLSRIENDYRGKKIALAYHDELFSVPENLYLIGLMNTADRSLAMIDYALRRRFSFFDMEPGFDTEGFKELKKSIGNELFDELISKIIKLNEEIENDKTLGSGFCIGHSYFCNLTKNTCTLQKLRSIVKHDILPMLKEYWFDEQDKYERWESQLQGLFK